MSGKITRRELIKTEALEILKINPDGVRYFDLVRAIKDIHPEIPNKTIQGSIWDIDKIMEDEVYKPARGLFRHTSFKEKAIIEEETQVTEKIKEEYFYKPFADWLVNELEECTKAIPLGGSKFKEKWGTPDVIGKRESRRSDIITIPTEIVSAEIKLDTRDLITAFGQACSYKLFSNKSYIVIPKRSSPDDISKLDALCLIFGLGLVLFDNNNIDEPNFEIRVRPLKHDPDMFYVNKYMKIIEKELFS